MSNVLRNMEKKKDRIPKKCCGRKKEFKKIEFDRTDADGKPYKLIKHGWVCPKCGRAQIID